MDLKVIFLPADQKEEIQNHSWTEYALDKEKFETSINKKIWNWHELSESDIIDACNRNNLEDYKRETFESVVWVCKTKKYNHKTCINGICLCGTIYNIIVRFI